MQLRRATLGDALDVLAWRNDPQTIAASKTGAVERAAHMAWFPKAIADERRALFIAEEDGRKLGIVRFDLGGGDAWLVSINVAPAERGKRYGEAILRAGIHAIGAARLLAEIKGDNIASIRIFEHCGFRCVGNYDGWLQFARAPKGLKRSAAIPTVEPS